MSVRKKVVGIITSKRNYGYGPSEYRLECGHTVYRYPRTKPTANGIEVIHPKTATCGYCEGSK